MHALDAHRQQLIEEHYPMVRAIARRMAARYPGSVDVDDLVSIGVLGLIDSAERYDRDRTTTFASYARIRIQGAIVDALREQDFVPRSVRQRARRFADARQRLGEELGRAPTTGELADELRIPAAQLEHVERHTQVYTVTSLDDTRHDSDDRVVDHVPAEQDSLVEATDRQGVREEVQRAVATLPERDQAIVRLYYHEDLSFKEIGQVLGITESRVSQLHTRIKQRLALALAAGG